MVLPESKNRVGLGRALMKSRGIGGGVGRRGGGGRGGGKGPVNDGSVRYQAELPKEFGSITEQAALDEFLATAELADTDFTAEKMNIKIIHPDQKNPYLLSPDEERNVLSKQRANRSQLTVPRRPKWDQSTTPAELDRLEKESFLHWRRSLAELQENKDLLMTPFERNLEMWRQLWRVIERSDLIVQIVDARNPLLFRCEDLENYVKEVDSRKKTLLLINKADMMTDKQRTVWADYFEKEGIAYTFFSAALAKEQLEEALIEEEDGEYEDLEEDDEEITEEELNAAAKSLDLEDDGEEDSEDDDEGGVVVPREAVAQGTEQAEKVAEGTSKAEGQDKSIQEVKELDDHNQMRIRILTADELEELFLSEAPEIEHAGGETERKTIIGLVGYPNVGKSSTINALIKAKKVSVSATPGKTKHFQTIHLSPSVILCDCPGLVFPNFASTKAELVCQGVLPIDQMREFTGPSALVAQRIPQAFLEALYGIKILTRPPEEGGTGMPTAEELLRAYASSRGFTKTGTAEPDESKAARVLLKDYVNGKLLFCRPPPANPPINPLDFNAELYDREHLPLKRQARYENAYDDTVAETSSLPGGAMQEFGEKSIGLDRQFFTKQGDGGAGHLRTPFQRPSTVNGKQLSGRKAKSLIILENNLSPEDAKRLFSGKKHFKGGRKK